MDAWFQDPWNIPLLLLVLLALAIVAAREMAPPSRCLVHDAGKVTVSEVSSEELRGSINATNKRYGNGSPAVRSVDIQPAAEMMAMRAPTVTPTPTITLSTPTIPTIPTIAPTVPMVSTPTIPTELRHHRPPRWKLSGYVLLTATMLALCSDKACATVTTAGYIVLVGIPVFDRVLPLKNLAQELLHRGYHVGLALPEHCRHWVSDLNHLEFISLGHLPSQPNSNANANANNAKSWPLPPTLVGDNSDLYDHYAKTLLFYASIQRPMLSVLLEELEEDRPALVIIDRYAFAGITACHKLGLPYVVHSPSLLIDMDTPPAYIPAPFSPFTMHTPSVVARCKNSWHRFRFRLAMVHVFRAINHVRVDYGLAEINSKDDLYGQQLVLVSSMFGLDEPRPVAPQFQMIGILEPPQRSTTTRLSSELNSWLSHDTVKPLVLISFSSDMPLSPEIVTYLLNGLEHIGARLVWKITLEEQAAFDLGDRPRESVFFLGDEDASMGEALVLQHAPVSLLITAGNHYSVLQALTLGVPVLGIPVTAEQWETMNMVTRTGSGVQLSQATLSDQDVHNAAMALLYKSEYAAAAFRLGEIIKTGGGTKRAADHVQSVLEFGVDHVLPARNLQPLYKTYLVDVYAVYGLILFCSAIVLRSCFAALYRLLQLAPDVHLGVALDDDGDDQQNGNGTSGDNGGNHNHHEVHKPTAHHHHHYHDHNHNHPHVALGKEKHV